MIRIKMTVRGMVQGVGFRYYCYRQADALGITGYAKNLYNGDVEIEAEGAEGVLNEFVKLIEIGPKFSRVNSVSVIRLPYEGKNKEFSIL
ncbi:MAG: acylphosphatase [Ignavibacteria bacterium]